MVGHHRVVAGFLNAKYRHVITSFRRSEKVFVFGEKTASTPPVYPGGENLWAAAVQPIVAEGTWDFRLLSGRFRSGSRVSNFKMCDGIRAALGRKKNAIEIWRFPLYDKFKHSVCCFKW